MNPNQFLEIIIEKFPIIKLDYERMKCFSDRITGISVMFESPMNSIFKPILSCNGQDGTIGITGISLTPRPASYSDEEWLRDSLEKLFNQGVTVEKVFVTFEPEKTSNESEEVNDAH